MMKTLLLALALLAVPADARPKPFSERVADEKASIRDAVDRAFVGVWPRMEPSATELGLTANAVRSAVLWRILGRTIGMCRATAPATLLADWYGAFDRLPFNDVFREEFRQGGYDGLTEGERSDLLAQLTDDEKATLCKPHLEAVRQLLREL